MHEMHYTEVEGTIDEIEPVEKRIKLVISHPVVEGIAPEDTPTRLRVSFRDDGMDRRPGDRVRMFATLFPLPAPIMPGSYDFARHFFFRHIGGNGFAMRAPEVIAPANESTGRIWLNNLRHTIGENMRTHMPGEVGTVAAAMTVGETGPIPEPVKQALRDSGLAHMLAIAGLHLGIVAGIVFFNTRLLLALSPAIALRFPIKKIAAAFALFSAFIYLALAGGPIPAQRAFIMVAVVFTGYMLDRQSISLRTLMIAACFILLVFPEAMFGASFQLSFAATLAIIALFERYAHALHPAGGDWKQTMYRHGLGIICTSLIATLATAPFILYNFNRFASFGVLSNMVVIPLATFVIMPGMVLSLILMPLHLQWIGYIPLKYGTQLMIWMAERVVSLPYASLKFAAPSDAGLIVCAFGLMWICLMWERWRLLGIPIILAGLSTMALHQPPDMLISRDAKQVMARLDDGRYTFLKGTGRSFVGKGWLRSEGFEEAVAIKNSGVPCNDGVCVYTHENLDIFFLKDPVSETSLAKACITPSDLLIGWRPLNTKICAGPKRFIGRRELERYGEHAVYLRGDDIRIERTRDKPGRRIWQLPVEVEDSSVE